MRIDGAYEQPAELWTRCQEESPDLLRRKSRQQVLVSNAVLSLRYQDETNKPVCVLCIELAWTGLVLGCSSEVAVQPVREGWLEEIFPHFFALLSLLLLCLVRWSF